MRENDTLRSELAERDQRLQEIKVRFNRVIKDLHRNEQPTGEVGEEELGPQPHLNMGVPEERDAQMYIDMLRVELQKAKRMLKQAKDNEAVLQVKLARMKTKAADDSSKVKDKARAEREDLKSKVKQLRRQLRDGEPAAPPGRVTRRFLVPAPVAPHPDLEGGSPAPSPPKAASLPATPFEQPVSPRRHSGGSGNVAPGYESGVQTLPARVALDSGTRSPRRTSGGSGASTPRRHTPRSYHMADEECQVELPILKDLSDSWTQTESWSKLLQSEGRVAGQVASAALSSYIPSSTDAATQAVVNSLRRENMVLQTQANTLREELESRQAAFARLSRERDALQEEQADTEARIIEDVKELQREVATKNSELVLLDSRYQQAKGAAETLRQQHKALVELNKRLNEDLTVHSQRALEAELALKTSENQKGVIEGLEAQLRDRTQEVGELHREYSQLMQHWHTTRNDVKNDVRQEYIQELEEKERALGESEKNNRKLFRELETLKAHCSEIKDEYIGAQKERDRLNVEVLRLAAENEGLKERVQLLGSDFPEGVDKDDDFHKAKALAAFSRARGEPTDLGFLLKVWDHTTEEGRLRAENTDLHSENLRLLSEVELLRQVNEQNKQRKAVVTDVDNRQKQLIEYQRNKISRLEEEVKYHRGVKQPSTEGDAASIDVGPNETVLEICVPHLALEAAKVAHDERPDEPPTLCISIDFFDFETVITDSATGWDVFFTRSTFCFTLTMDAALRDVFQRRTVDVDINLVEGVRHRKIGRCQLHLKRFLQQGASLQHLDHCHVMTLDKSDSLGHLEYKLALKKPLPPAWEEESLFSLPTSLEDPETARFKYIDGIQLQLQDGDLTRGTQSGRDPIPYVLITAISPVDYPDDIVLPDVTVEMTAPRRTLNPRFRFTHIYNVNRVSKILMRYLRDAVLHLLVLDDGVDDAKAPPLGRATLSLVPLLAGPGESIDARLQLTNDLGDDAGTLGVTVMWTKAVRDGINFVS